MNGLAEQIKAADARADEAYREWMDAEAIKGVAFNKWLAARHELDQLQRKQEIADAIEASKGEI